MKKVKDDSICEMLYWRMPKPILGFPLQMVLNTTAYFWGIFDNYMTIASLKANYEVTWPWFSLEEESGLCVPVLGHPNPKKKLTWLIAKQSLSITFNDDLVIYKAKYNVRTNASQWSFARGKNAHGWIQCKQRCGGGYK